MLGTRRTVPLWRQRHRRLLALERALAPGRSGRDTHAEQAMIIAKAEQRRQDEARRRMKFMDTD